MHSLFNSCRDSSINGSPEDAAPIEPNHNASAGAGNGTSTALYAQPMALEPVTAKSSEQRHHRTGGRILLANARVSRLPLKTEDGGTIRSADATAGRDAFMAYSDDAARRAAMLFQDAEGEGGGPGGVGRGANGPIRRSTRLSFELHSDEFYQDAI